jgi:fructose-bisphosphate aldolase, class I
MDLHSLLGDEAGSLLSYECKGVPRDDLILPGPDAIDQVMSWSDRPIQVLRNLATDLPGGRRYRLVT